MAILEAAMSINNSKRHSSAIQAHYDEIAPERSKYLIRNRYFYKRDLKNLTNLISRNSRVLEIGCATGELLNNLNPSYGVGVDISSKMIEIARARFPRLNFLVANIEDNDWFKSLEGPFDYIILSDVIGHLFDIQGALDQLHNIMTNKTKIIVTFMNRWWEPLAKAYIRFGFGMPRPPQNWLAYNDFSNLLDITGFNLVSFQRRELSPWRFLGLGSVINRYIAPLPWINSINWRYYIVAQSRKSFLREDKTVSVIVPCRNEKGNIEACVSRLPNMGKGKMEIIFVEGNSSDATFEECLRVQDKYPNKNIQVLKQQGRGKSDAVKLGVRKAKGEILIIFDSDLAVPAEYMPRVYNALTEGGAEFVNCTRLIYPMEKRAMRPLNYVANRLFAIILSYLLDRRLTDTLCGTKALFKDEFDRIDEEIQRHGSYDPFGDFDLIFGAASRNLRTVEIPVRYEARRYGETQISRFRDGLRLFRMVFVAFYRLKFR
jgi:SAM-dependent methyltransferase